MAHRVCNQTYIRLFIINYLVRRLFKKAVPKAVRGGLLARSGFPSLRSLAAVRLRVTYAGRSRHCFLTNEWPLLYHGQHCESRKKRTRALSRKLPQAKVRRMHALPASVGIGLHQALRSALEANALGRQRIMPVTARVMIGLARDRRRGRLPMCLSPCQGHFDSRLKSIPVPVLQ